MTTAGLFTYKKKRKNDKKRGSPPTQGWVGVRLNGGRETHVCPNRGCWEETGAEREFSLERSPHPHPPHSVFPHRWSSSKLPSWLGGAETRTQTSEAWFHIHRGGESSRDQSAHSLWKIRSRALAKAVCLAVTCVCRTALTTLTQLRPGVLTPGSPLLLQHVRVSEGCSKRFCSFIHPEVAFFRCKKHFFLALIVPLDEIWRKCSTFLPVVQMFPWA